MKDCVGAAPGFLASLAEQTRAPDEVVIVDGGSNDGTADAFGASGAATVLSEPGANISRGRNVALAAATHDVIAVTDADCELDPRWLEAIVAPIEAGAQVSMGVTEPVVETTWDRCMAAVNLPLDASSVDVARFNPSHRSVAFRREAIDAVGGYPEWLPIGEDMWVDRRWRELGMDMRLAPDAAVRWRLRRGLAATWRQYFAYARGDAQAGMHPDRHAVRLAVYAGLVAAFASGRTGPRLLAAAGAVAYARTPVARGWARSRGPRDRAVATAAVPALLGFLDAAKIAGYAAGLADRVRRPR
ncbi:MAG TPA: glycosyltransferase [Actinomycetota bacterium]|nr:glycosyltransferase [Actinomycetota bacterium]